MQPKKLKNVMQTFASDWKLISVSPSSFNHKLNTITFVPWCPRSLNCSLVRSQLNQKKKNNKFLQTLI